MDSDIQNLEEIENLIRNDPQNADRIASQASVLARRIQGKIPETISLTNAEQIFAFAANNPQLNLSEENIKTIVEGKKIEEVYSLMRDRAESTEQGEMNDASFSSPLVAPFLASLYLAKPKPQVKEQDAKYKKISEEKEKQWLRDNPGKDFESEEGIDYLYGSLNKRLDDPTTRTIAKDAEQDFKEKHKLMSDTYDKKKEKIHKNIADDQEVNYVGFRTNEHTNARLALWKKQNPKATKEQIEAMEEKLRKQIERHEYRKFVLDNKTKAEAYALRDQKDETAKKIKKSLESVQNEEKRREAQQKRMAEKRLRRQEQQKIIEEKRKTQQQQGSSPQPSIPRRPQATPPSAAKPLSPPSPSQQAPIINVRSTPLTQQGITFRPSPSAIQTPRGGPGTRIINAANRFASRARIPKIPGLPSVGNLATKAISRIFITYGLPIIIGAIILITFILIVSGELPIIGGTGGSTPPPSTGILACSFTRSGTSSTIKSTILQQWFIDIGTSIGVPPAILASVAMHESPDFVTNADDSNDAIKTNHYCSTGQTVCVAPDNKTSYVRSCTSSEKASGWREGHAQGLMQIMDLYHPSDDLCSITTSITIAAQQLKSLGVTLSPTESDVDSAIKSYFGSSSCTYGAGYSYCDEVWKDYTTCTSASTPINPNPSYKRVFYCQGDPAWDDRSSCGLGGAGCGPSSMAIVLSSFGLSSMTPPVVDDVFEQNGWRIRNPTAGQDCISSEIAAIESSWFKNLGFTYDPICWGADCKNSLKQMQDSLAAGYLIIGSSDNYPCANCKIDRVNGTKFTVSHIFVIEGVGTDGTINVIDPNNCDYGTGKEGSKNVVNSNTFDWKYAYAVKSNVVH